MTNYYVEILNGESKTAGSKAKEDAHVIFQSLGYTPITYRIKDNKVLKILIGIRDIDLMMKKLNRSDRVIYQYPAYSQRLTNYYIKKATEKGLVNILFIHDVESLRYKKDQKEIEKEVSFFNQFNQIIVHNDIMMEWMKENGVRRPMYSLKIFDYLDESHNNNFKFSMPVVFAGNLIKSDFLIHWPNNTKINIYGINPGIYPSNAHYKGSFSSDELGNAIEGSFGLVWDGPSIDSCVGMFGEYMRYNAPHKLSMYLSIGMPVILWDKAAMSEFVLKNKVGFVVSSLYEIDQKINQLKLEDYMEMKENSLKISRRLRDGYYLKKVMDELTE